jgi:hypothetical protein
MNSPTIASSSARKQSPLGLLWPSMILADSLHNRRGVFERFLVDRAVSVQAQRSQLDPAVQSGTQMLLRLVCVALLDQGGDRGVVEVFDFGERGAPARAELACGP